MTIDCFKCKTSGQIQIGSDKPRCSSCGYTASPEEVAAAYVEDVLGIHPYEARKGGEWPQYDCPECDANAMVLTKEEPEYFLCFGCGGSWQDGELEICAGRCNRYRELEDSSICDECFAEKIEED